MKQNQIKREQPVNSNTEESMHLRAAFAIIGALIGRGAIQVDFTDTNWCDEFQFNAETVAETLDALELEA